MLTKYIFKQSKHNVCFITSVPCLATLGFFFLVENGKLKGMGIYQGMHVYLIFYSI